MENKKLNSLICGLMDSLKSVTQPGFFGSVSVEMQVQNGTIQAYRIITSELKRIKEEGPFIRRPEKG